MTEQMDAPYSVTHDDLTPGTASNADTFAGLRSAISTTRLSASSEKGAICWRFASFMRHTFSASSSVSGLAAGICD